MDNVHNLFGRSSRSNTPSDEPMEPSVDLANTYYQRDLDQGHDPFLKSPDSDDDTLNLLARKETLLHRFPQYEQEIEEAFANAVGDASLSNGDAYEAIHVALDEIATRASAEEEIEPPYTGSVKLGNYATRYTSVREDAPVAPLIPLFGARQK